MHLSSASPRQLVPALLLSGLLFFSCKSGESAAQNFGKILEAAQSSSATPSSLEISEGLKQALEKGTGVSADALSQVDGYLKNPAVKILLPKEAESVERTLRSIGLGSLCDQAITSLNRAAEDAAKSAQPIFVNAIKQMSFQDVKGILLGQNDAATQYFQRTTTSALTESFSPTVKASLEKVNATKYWSDLMTQYNKVPMVKPVNTDLTAYVTEKAVQGLFVEIAKEELKIRENIAERSTPTLKKVFGYADRQQN